MITVHVPITKCKLCPNSEWYTAFEKTRVTTKTRHMMCTLNKVTVDPERIHKSCPFINKNIDVT